MSIWSSMLGGLILKQIFRLIFLLFRLSDTRKRLVKRAQLFMEIVPIMPVVIVKSLITA